MADDPTDLPDDSVRDINQQVNRLRQLAGEYSKLKKELEDVGNETIESYKRATGEASELGKQLEKVLANRRKITSTLESEIEALKEEAVLSSTIQKRQDAQRKIIAKQLELEKEKAKQYSDQEEAMEKIVQKQKDLNKEAKDQLDIEEKIAKTKSEQNEEYEKLKQNLDSINNSFTSSLSSVKRLASGDIIGGLRGVAGSIFDISKVMAKSAGEDSLISKILDPVGTLGNVMLENLKENQDAIIKGMAKDVDSVTSNVTNAASTMDDLGTAAAAAAPATASAGAEVAAAGAAASTTAPAMGAAASQTAAMGSASATAAGGITAATVATGGLAIAIIAVLAVVALAVGSFVFLAKEIITFNIAIFDANKQIERTTYLSKQNSQALLANANKMKILGVTTEDMVAATQSLVSGFRDFTKETPDTQRSLVEITSVFNRLGMSADNVTKSLVFLTKGMGQDVPAAAARLRELEILSRQLQIPFSELGQEFANASSFLTSFGNKGTEVFKELAMVSKNTNIEIGRLIAMTQKFDTFEGAAQAAGKLNAALGGNFVNAMELVTTVSPAERFGMIRDAILESGLAFNEMEYYQKKMIAASAGLEGVGELALVMSGNFDLLSGSVEKTQEEFVTAEERSRDLQGFMEKLKNIAHSLIQVFDADAMQNFEEITVAFAESLSNKDVQNNIKQVGSALVEMAPLFIKLAESVGGFMSAITTLATVGEMILAPFVSLAEKFLSLTNSIFAGRFGDAFVYATQIGLEQVPGSGLVSQGFGMAAEAIMGTEQVDSGAARRFKAVKRQAAATQKAEADAAAAARASATTAATNNITTNNSPTTVSNGDIVTVNVDGVQAFSNAAAAAATR